MKKDINEFPLAWRWTQSTHNVLPDSVMSQLEPLTTEDADRLQERYQFVLNGPSLKRELFYSFKSHTIIDDKVDMTPSFLAMLGIDNDALVFLCWGGGMAIRTAWGIFRQYWGDFCYPGSDDVIIVPEDDAWVLFYCHEDMFEFGMRKKTKG